MAIWKWCQPFWVADSDFADHVGGLLYYSLRLLEGHAALAGKSQGHSIVRGSSHGRFREGYPETDGVSSCEDFTLTLTLSLKGEGMRDAWF